jgi:hypothetical protein
MLPVMFNFNGNKIFISIDDKPKMVNSNQLKSKKYKKNPNVTLLIDTYNDKDCIIFLI